jgi:TolB protein
MTMRYSFFSFFLSVLLVMGLCTPFIAASADDRVYVDITASSTRKINFAVPWFANSQSADQNQSMGRDIADTLGKALEFHGVIGITPTAEYGGTQSANWKQLGVDYAVLGQYSLSASKLSLEIRVLDIATNQTLLGKSFTGSPQQRDDMLFKFCDNVIEALTGKPGIAQTKIAFISYRNNSKEVYLTDILGRKLRQVTRHKNLTVSPRFTPDGKQLCYTSYHSGNQNLYITDLSQNKVTRVLSKRKGMNLAPAWSPDGRYMILTLSMNGNPDLYLCDANARIIEQLTDRAGINVSATWSPDGRQIVFVSDRSGKPHLYLMNLSSRQVQRLTFEGSENAEPSWSPTENLIVYSSLRDGVYQICTIKPEGGAVAEQITTDLSHHEAPSWSPDGNQIIFSKGSGNRHQIYAVMKNGSFQRPVLTSAGNNTYPRWSR